jgi:3-hydroxybutyryl-CoA dehydrogenase
MNIVIIGCGRMGQGIAITFALAGYKLKLIDIKKRSKNDFNKLLIKINSGISKNLEILNNIKLINKNKIKKIFNNIEVIKYGGNNNLISSADIIFECVPEKLKIKKDVFKLLSENTNKKTIISSTTSTILSSELSKYNKHPERFLNAHWLNPPYLMPLIEISPCNETSKSNIKKVYNLFIEIGKVPITSKPSPGYIVPRIQSLAMNEAARILEEGTASAEDIDKSVIYGFGLRFAILGLLEFIDWGGIDTLDNASSYMTKAMKSKRFSTPNIVKKHIKDNNLGLSTQSGFMNWKNIDIDKYQEEKLKNFVKITKLLNIQPKIKI